MSLWRSIFGGQATARPMIELYEAIVERAREPGWYRQGAVADTIDGRFDMLVLIMALVLLRLDREGETLRQTAVHLTERFIEDMDGELRQIGVGDFVVGKHVGKMMGALGGRIDAYQAGLASGGDLESALVRNLYRGETPPSDALAYVGDEIRRLNHAIDDCPLDRLVEGELPQ